VASVTAFRMTPGITRCASWSTTNFLRHQASIGNDLITPRPEFGFPGLKAGDGWCVCAQPWKKSFEAGIRVPVRLEATNERALEVVSLELLLKSARLN
jgi:uncharacterized protein